MRIINGNMIMGVMMIKIIENDMIKEEVIMDGLKEIVRIMEEIMEILLKNTFYRGLYQKMGNTSIYMMGINVI